MLAEENNPCLWSLIVLFFRCGHLKLADFGSASKLNSSGFVTSAMPAGTPDYIAPEVLVAVESSKTDKYGVCVNAFK